MKYIAPAYLAVIFILWVLFNLLGWNGQFSAPTFNPDRLRGRPDRFG